MSPATVDAGETSPPCPNGQTLYPHFNSLNFFNGNRLGYTGFSNQMESGFGFDSSSLDQSKPAGGLSRPPRLAKQRKPSGGQRPNRLRSVSQIGVDPRLEDPGTAKPAFEYSQQNVGRGFLFKSNDGSQSALNNNVEASKVMDGMSRLKIEGDKAYSNSMKADNIGRSSIDSSIGSDNVHLSSKDHSLQGIDESVDSELPEDMRRLYIESEHFSKLHGGNMEELPNKMKKLNVKENISYGRIDRTSLGGCSDELLSEKMRNLKTNDSLYNDMNVKVDNASSTDKNKLVFEYDRYANQPVDMNMAYTARDSSSHLKTNTSLSSDVSAMHGFPTMNPSNINSDNTSGLFSSRFTFQALESENCGAHVNASSTTLLPMFSSSGIHHTPLGGASEMPSMDGGDRRIEFCVSRKFDNMPAQNVEFKTPDPKAHSLFGLNKKLDTKREPVKDSGFKKKKGKSKKSVQVPLKFHHDIVFEENLQEHTESSEQYSPMDFSPYEETLANNTCSRDTSDASGESFSLGENNSSAGSCPNVPSDIGDEVLVSATERLYINEYDMRDNEGRDEQSTSVGDDAIRVESAEEDAVSGAETESFKSAADELDYNTDSFHTAADTEVSSSGKIERQDRDGGPQFEYKIERQDRDGGPQFEYKIERQDRDGGPQFERQDRDGGPQSADMLSGDFTFAASSASFGESSTSMRIPKKKTRSKHSHDSYSSTPSVKVLNVSSSHLPSFQVPGPSLSLREQAHKANFSTMLSQKSNNSEQVQELATKQDSATAATIAAQESCEKWRLRGNQAYAKGEFSKAEDYYTQGLNCISQEETSRSCLRALMLCYSNRAATRMSLGRHREALEDCARASELDPSFLKVQIRAASCYLTLGEVENASLHFMKCLQTGPEASTDRKLLVEASEGLEKAKRVAECMIRAAELLGRSSTSDIECAVSIISEGLLISSYSTKLLQMKGDALFKLRKYEELIRFCEQLLDSVESNFLIPGVDSHIVDFHGSDLKKAPSFRVWCLSLIIKSFFYLGRLEEALVILKKQEEQMPLVARGNRSLDSMIPLAGTIHELLHRKAAGNEAYRSGKHADAVEHYTAAISCSLESRPFTAICVCNRAAAYRSMGQPLDAIADCCLAIALDRHYYKAISRRAAIYEMIRDYEQAVADLQKLVSTLTGEVEKKFNQSVRSDKVDIVNELRQARLKLSEMEEFTRNQTPLNMYLILGVDPSASASEIKKAYRKAALKYHPDKAGQSLVRYENSDDPIWNEIAEEVHKDADRLFKIIGEAYAVLSNPTKRSRYDLEEEVRNARSGSGSGSNNSKNASDFQNHMFERNRRTYGNSARGSERNHYNWYS